MTSAECDTELTIYTVDDLLGDLYAPRVSLLG